MKITLNTDGGVRTGGVKGPTQGRSGLGAIGFVIRGEDGTLLKKGAMILEGDMTVNDCEYSAVIAGLYNAHLLGATHVTLRSDSQLVVQQLRGAWQVKSPQLQEYVDEVRIQMADFDAVEVEWVPRTKNQHADLLARELLDDAAA